MNQWLLKLLDKGEARRDCVFSCFCFGIQVKSDKIQFMYKLFDLPFEILQRKSGISFKYLKNVKALSSFF